MSRDDLDDAFVDLVVRRLNARVHAITGQSTVLIESGTRWPDLRGRRPAICSIFCRIRDQPSPIRDLSRIAFLDVETTGLNAGVGTLVFVVGIASIRDNAIMLTQFFLHDPATETAFLLAVANYLRDFDQIVTFNGRRFDLPLLVGRFDLYRMSDPIPSQHVDLLFLARRIWARRLRKSNLSTLESRILGLGRVNDLPGSEAPGRYFDYLHERDIDGVMPVIDHNRQDLISMVLLADRIGVLLDDVVSAADVAPSDYLGLGSLFEDLDRVEDATRCYESCLVGGATTERAEALFRLAQLANRAQDLDRVVQLLAAVSAFNVDWAVLASIELAKIHEHRKRQPDEALVYARRALALTHTLSSPGCARVAPAVSHRIQRLEQKAKRNGYLSSNQ